MEEMLPFEPEPSAAPSDNRLIFLVEDDPGQAETLAAQLGHYGYEVRSFTDLHELRAALEESVPAAIVMDMILPQGSLAGARGLLALRELRDLRTPVLFLSVRSDFEARLEAVRAGADAYFTKPGDVGTLVDRLDELTGRRSPEPYRVLIVDDEADFAEHTAWILRRAGMIAAVVTNPLEVTTPLGELRPDLILLDAYMPSASGLEVAAVIRQHPEFVGIPIVFLSAETRLEQQLDARRAGAEDFLTKPISPDRLTAEVTLRVQRSRVLRSFMTRDGHTGLLNHTSFMGQLQTEVQRARRRRSSLVYAMFDLDRFKSVNDTYGHPTGDRVLRSLARVLQQRLRKTDLIGRTGGDEFAALMIDTDEANALRVISEIQSGFSQIGHLTATGEVRVTFSGGLAAFPRWPDAVALAAAADRALYAAKRQGRNRLSTAGRETGADRAAASLGTVLTRPGGGHKLSSSEV